MSRYFIPLLPMNDPTSQPSDPPSGSIADLLAQLQTAIVGLQWISESEFPFEVVQWAQDAATPGSEMIPDSELTPDLLLKLADRDPETPVQTTAIEAFFEWVTQAQDWHSPEEAAAVDRYQNLLQLLKNQLQSPQVYRLGAINLEIYILGAAAKAWVGVKTQAVET